MAEERDNVKLWKEYYLIGEKYGIALHEHGRNSDVYRKYRDEFESWRHKNDGKLKKRQLPKKDNEQTEKYDEQTLEAVVRESLKQRFKMVHEAAKVKLPESLHQEVVDEKVNDILKDIRDIRLWYMNEAWRYYCLELR
jgi:hypothetical protein